MAGTHSVGSLFVNISGSTKGLTKSLRDAKKQISGFGSSAIRDQQKRVDEARGKAVDAIQDMRIARMSGDPAALVKTRRSSLEATRQFRSERGELTRMQAAKTMGMTLGILGIGLAAFQKLMGTVLRRGGEAIESQKPFAMLGPSGGRTVDAQIGMIMDKLAFAQSARGSEIMARQTELQRREEELNRQWAEITIVWRELGYEITNMIIGPRGTDYEQAERDRRTRMQTGHGKTGVG
jgi:hypothetical protein